MQIVATKNFVRETLRISVPGQRRYLIGACLAHVLHDGYTDQLSALLPVWRAQFGLSYAGLAAVRALYYGTMSCLQIAVAIHPLVASASSKGDASDLAAVQAE